MKLINNHVHTTQLCTAANYSIVPTLLTQFGYFPKFELPSAHTLIVEGQPRDGLRGLIFSAACFHPDGLQLYTNSDTSRPARWVTAYRWLWKMGCKIVGTVISPRESDQFKLTHTLDNSGTVFRFDFDVTIEAHVADPQRYYLFLRQNVKNGDQLRLTIRNLCADFIDAQIKAKGGTPPSTSHVKLVHPLLEEAGYVVDDCRVEYVSK